MTEIQPYTFPATGQEVRTVLIDGEPWFVAADVCRVLGLSNSTMALRALEADEKGLSPIETPGGEQRVSIVNESGMYALIVRSDKPNAKPFRRWVTGTVLPEIRKTGRFELVPAAPQWTIPGTYAEALELAAVQARTIEEKDHQIEEQRAALDWAEPRAAYVDRFVDGAGDASTIRAVAKQLDVPERKFFAWLIERGLIYKTAAGEYMQRAQLGPRRNWFVLRDQPQAPRHHNGQLRTTLYVTPAGKSGIEALLAKYPITGQGELDIEGEAS